MPIPHHDDRWMPLTLGQIDFWEEFTAHPDQPVSTVAHLTHFHGTVDEGALVRAINALSAEADVLSLRLSQTEPPFQSVDAACRPILRQLDLRHAPDPELQARALMQNDLSQPLNLRGRGLSALWLIRTKEDNWLWYCRGHHIFLDGYSMALIERRTAQLYDQFSTGATPARPLGRFADYLREEQAYDACPAHEKARSFWRTRLSEGPPPPMLDKGAENYPATPRIAEIDLTDLGAPLCHRAMDLGLGWPDLLTALIGLWLGHHSTGRAAGGERIVWLPLMNRFASVSATVPAMVLNIIPWHLPKAEGSLGDAVSDYAATLRMLRRHGRCRIEQMAADQGLRRDQRFFFSPLVNVMPFDPPVFTGCTTRREVLAAGPGDGFNVSVSATSRAQSMWLTLEADPQLTSCRRFAFHATGLPQFLRNAVHAPDGALLERLLKSDCRTSAR